jgi:hypothetical protein
MRTNKMATKSQTKPETKSQLERIRDTYPRYADLIVKQSALLVRQEVVHALAVPLAERGKRAMASWQAQLPRAKPVPVVHHAGAAALLGELLPELTPEQINPPPPRPSWDGEVELSELSAEAESIQEALKLLAGELTKARREYSKLKETMRIEESSPDARGNDIIQYRCGRCDRIERVRLIRGSRDAAAPE